MPLVKLDPEYKTRRRAQDINARIEYGTISQLAKRLGWSRQRTSQNLKGDVNNMSVKFISELVQITDWTDAEIVKFIRGDY